MLQQPLALAIRQPAPQKSGDPPAAQWRFEESETKASAETNLTVHGTPRWVPGRDGNALEFDGSGTWAESPRTSDIDFHDGLAIAAWVRTQESKPATVFAKGDAWRVQLLDGKVEFALTGPTTTGTSRGKPPAVRSTRTVNDGQWHHVAAGYDGKRIVLYIDGVEESHATATGSLVLNNVPVSFGDNAFSRGLLFSGSIDDVRLFNRGMIADEVQAMHRKVAN